MTSHPLRLAVLLLLGAASLPALGVAQTLEEEKKLFEGEFNEEDFFRLEEEAVTIASKHAQSTREAPATVSVISAEDISRYGFRDLADLLRTVAGWYVSNGYDYYYAGNRGIMLKGDQNTRVLLLIDGHTMNEGWTSSSSFDELLGLDLAAISRVEVLQGPSSTLYGSNAFLGIINIVTKAGEEVGRGASHVLLGSNGWTRISVASGNKTGGIEYHARAMGTLSSGRYLYFPDRTEGPSGGFTPPEADAVRGGSLFARVQAGDLRVMAQLSNRLKHVPIAPYNTVLGDPTTRYEQTRMYMEARYSRELKAGRELMARAWYDGYRFDDHLLTWEDEAPTDPTQEWGTYLFRDRARADQGGAELQLGFELANGPTLRDQLYVGVESSYAATVSESFVSEGAEELDKVSVPVNGLLVGAYAQNELVAAEKLHVVLGLRFDYNQNFFDPAQVLETLSPRGAVIYKARNDSTFKLMYARGFRNPSVYEAFFEDGADIAANDSLRPESIQNLEFAYEYRQKKTLKLGVGLYYFQATNLLRQQTICLDGSLELESCTEIRQQFQNVAQVQGLGSEATLQVNLDNGVVARGTLALQQSTDLADYRPLTNSPTALANLMASYPVIKDKGSLALHLHAVSPRTIGPDASGAYETLPANLLLNLVFNSQELVKGVSLTTGVYNLLDWRVPDVAVSEDIVVDHTDQQVLTVPQDGRTFAFQLGYKF